MTVETLQLTQEFVAGPARIRFDVVGSQPVDTALADKDFLDYRLADVRIETEPTLREADIVWERDAEKSIAYDGRRMTFRGDWASGPIQKVVVTMLALRLEENGLHPFHASAVRYRDKTVLFNVELLYGGVFRIEGFSQEHMLPVLFIECPRLLFPFARQIIAEATRNGGFPPLMLDPIDFAQMFQQKLAEDAAKAKVQVS